MAPVQLIPFLCTDCRVLFRPSLIGIGAGTTASISNVTTNCPFCSGEAHAINGVYQNVGNALRLISKSNLADAEVRRLSTVLKSLSVQITLTSEAVVDAVVREAPELASLRDWLPRTRSELYAFLTLLLAALAHWPNSATDSSSKAVAVAQSTVAVNVDTVTVSAPQSISEAEIHALVDKAVEEACRRPRNRVAPQKSGTKPPKDLEKLRRAAKAARKARRDCR